MKIQQEIWLEGQSFVEETRELFLEGIKCYKAGAYKASLLFSYLGLQSIIKNRVMESDKPDGYAQTEWDHKKRDLIHDDETWEKKVQELVKNKTKPVFKLSQDVYDQYFYWKDRRNDCAHAKGNYISYPHVEAFWLFVQSNNQKFFVNGGKDFILKQLQDHYDLSKTPPNLDVSPIISKIPQAIEKADYHNLLESIESLTLQDSKTKHKKMEIWSAIANVPELAKDFVEYLKADSKSEFSLYLFRREPRLISMFNGESTFIRKTWMKFNSEFYDYYIFIEMIRNSLIPIEQQEELYKRMFNKVSSDAFEFDNWIIDEEIKEVDRMLLDSSGFFNMFYKIAFEDRKIVTDFNWGNRNKGLVSYYLKYFDLDYVIVSAINRSFIATYPPIHLKSEIIDFYNENPHIKQKHNEISEENGDKVPKGIKLN
ncbi:hypothetical protein D0439_10090 [Lysinibacillus fusiformis]|uniref:hypothetical protein n=1 Tax=Lysinibacillus fusiformis TaxID=28031 RepID=UPI0011BBCA22|nr:hypothetical protein [Lysinibacillus fusiformis]QDZ98960.1 hypothetical protein D0439_10090 [Lysinibacillus fusiformis]